MKTIKRISEDISFSLFNNYEFVRKIIRKINEVIDAVNSSPAPVPSEKELPDVSVSDNGDALIVANGAWTKGTPQHNYSTTEKIIGKWVDGSDLYEKTLELNFTMTEWNSSDRYFLKDISDILPNADVVLFMGGYVKAGTTGYALNTAYEFTQMEYHIGINIYSSGLRLYLGSSRNVNTFVNYPYYAIVRYTKSTPPVES